MKIDVFHIAKLANLPLKPAELKKFGAQLASILDYFRQLNKVETTNAEPTSQVTGLENVFRDDQPSPSLRQEEILKNTKSQKNGFFKVKAIFGE